MHILLHEARTLKGQEGVFAVKGARFRGKWGLSALGGGRRGPIYRENEPLFR